MSQLKTRKRKESITTPDNIRRIEDEVGNWSQWKKDHLLLGFSEYQTKIKQEEVLKETADDAGSLKGFV